MEIKLSSLDGRKIILWEEIKPIIADSKGKEIEAIVERGAERKHLLVKPRLSKTKNILGEEESTYLIGVSPAGNTIIERRNPWDAVIGSISKTWDISKLTLTCRGKNVRGGYFTKDFGRPHFYRSGIRSYGQGRNHTIHSFYGNSFY